MRALLVPCLVALAFSSCRSESVESVAARHRGAVEKKFAALRELAPLVATVPAFTEPKVQPLAVPLVVDAKSLEQVNAMFVYEADLAKPGAASAVPVRTLDSSPLLNCGSLLAEGKLYGVSHLPGPRATESWLTACERVRYALVIRQLDFLEPVPSQFGRFVPGRYRGEVLVYELGDKPRLVGGYPFEARSSEDVEFLEGTPVSAQLIDNLEAQVFSALQDATRKAIAGSLPPPVL